jgi:aspartyl-tRNA(Asn)/glutamyl-tRNA(Gln) amidotransferase subunit C
MAITRQQVEHVARLARITIGEHEIERFARQIDAVLEYVAALGTLDTEGVPPTFHAIDLTNALRDDRQTGHLDRAAALANAPSAEEGYFVVPKVVGG